MEQFKLRESDEFIKLGQVLKAGRKLYPGDTATFDGNEIKIEK